MDKNRTTQAPGSMGSMKWAWKIGRLAGIDVFVHATFLLLVGWVVLSSWLGGAGVDMMVDRGGFMLLLFACIVLHELGHALAARRFGIQTRDITLLPIGGVARLERMPEHPRQELWVALAGPAVNVAIALGLFLWLGYTGFVDLLSGLSFSSGSLIERLLAANISLVLFNLLPAFPMDGGRVLRALLAMRTEYVRATQIAASIGQSMALLFGFVGLFLNPFLVFIALFVWIGASQEAAMVQMKSALGGIPFGRAMITDFRSLSPADSLARAVDLVLTGSQQDFPVVETGRVVGILTRSNLLLALARHGEQGLVGEVMERDFLTIDATDMLDSAAARIQGCHCHTVPVMHRNLLAGLLTMDNLGEFLMIQATLKGNSTHEAATVLAHGFERRIS